jgi:hypothetical protein
MPGDVADNGTGRLGSRRECDTLEALVDSVRADQSRALVVRGVAGIGTSGFLGDVVLAAFGCACGGPHH